MDWNGLEKALEDYYKGEKSGHGWDHTKRVTALAMHIAQVEGADKNLCRLAALLHDVDDWKLVGGPMGQSAHARDFMDRFHVPLSVQDEVLSIIASVSFKGTDSVLPSTREGRVVQDADRLDALGAIGVARAFSYGAVHGRAMYDPQEKPHIGMDEKEYMRSKGTTINHFHEKLLLLEEMMGTDEGKRLARGRTEFLRTFLAEFLAEWNGEK